MASDLRWCSGGISDFLTDPSVLAGEEEEKEEVVAGPLPPAPAAVEVAATVAAAVSSCSFCGK